MNKPISFVCATVVAAWLVAGPSPFAAEAQDPQDAPTMSMEDFPATSEPPADAPAAREVAAANRKGTAKNIAWRKSFEQAKSQARSGQIIVVDVYTDWCGYCKVMDRKVYAAQTVVDFSGEHVFVKLNAEDGAEGTRFARGLGVTGFPTTVIFNSQGKLIAKKAGAFREPDHFLDWLRGTSGI